MPSLDHEDFGHLPHRPDEGWVGWVHLPRFAKCRDAEFDGNLDAVEEATTDESVDGLRYKTRHARRQQELAEGRFRLVILDPEKEGPTDAQQEAFASLIEHEAEVLDAVLHSVLERYREGGDWTLDGFVRDHIGPAVETPEDLKECLRLESVVVLRDETDATVPITFHFSSPLDEEHGIEVTTVGTEVEDSFGESDRTDPFSGRKLLRFPFDLSGLVDASAIEPSADGHRFVELLYHGYWSGVFVVDPSTQCVGVVSNTFPRPLSNPKEIQDIRALTPLRRWRASLRVQRAVLMLVGVVNWLIALPCLIIAWMYEPRLFWACIVFGLTAHTAYFVFRRSGDHLFGLATGHIVLSVGGLVYASRVHDFGGPEHTAAATGVFGLILWWGTCAIAVIASLVFVATVISLGREFLRDGLPTLMFVAPGVLCIAALVLGLFATSSWHWSTLHLLWITPVSLAGSVIVFFVTLVFIPSGESMKTPCPYCGKPLATPAAKQCLFCGTDWHRNSTDDDADLADL